MVPTLFYAPASTANTIANGPNFSHGPLQPPALSLTLLQDGREANRACFHPKDVIPSICCKKQKFSFTKESKQVDKSRNH